MIQPVDVALIATALVGCAVALAPVLPDAVRIPALVFFGLVWVTSVLVAGLDGLRRALSWPDDTVMRVMTLAALSGIALAVIASTELSVLRLWLGDAALTWHIDWRYALNHAQAVERFGDIESSLDYAGASIDYHVGPAWLAGAFSRVFGIDVDLFLFGVLPLASGIALTLSLIILLRQFHVPYRAAAFAVALAYATPGILRMVPPDMAWAFKNTSLMLLDFENQFFLGSMLNSLLGLAVGVAGIALLTRPGANVFFRMLGVFGLAAVVAIKPQYFVGLGAFLGAIAVVLMCCPGRSAPRAYWLLAWALVTLLVAVILLRVSPGFPAVFSGVEWTPGETAYAHRLGLDEWRTIPAVVILISATSMAGVWFAGRGGRAWSSGLYRPSVLFVSGIGALVAMAAGLYQLRFQIKQVLIDRATELGNAGWALAQETNLSQILIPLRFLTLVAAVACIALFLIALQRLHPRLGIVLAAMVGAFSLLPVMALNAAFDDPYRGHEAAVDTGLYRLLESIPRDGATLIASDLADPAQSYLRTLNAPLLTAYHGHTFYVSNLRYVHWVREDASHRRRELEVFFGSRWSSWHTSWLARNGITHVLVNDRCRPLWLNQPGLPLRQIAASKIGSRWVAYASDGSSGPKDEALHEPHWSPLRAEFGRSGCLRFD